MRTCGYSVLELLMSSVLMVGVFLLGSYAFNSSKNQSMAIVAKQSASAEVARLTGAIRKMVDLRYAPDAGAGELPAIEGFTSTAFPTVGCANTVLTPACQNLRIRQRSPEDPTGVIVRKVEFTTTCQATSTLSVPLIPSSISYGEVEKPHVSLCCPANQVPVVKMSVWNNQNDALPARTEFYPQSVWGVLACFRVSSGDLLVELGALHAGVGNKQVLAYSTSESISLSRSSTVESIPQY